MSEVVELVKTVGFPIAMCLLIYLDLRKQIIGLKESLDKLLNKVVP